jgi:hypothetical protein
MLGVAGGRDKGDEIRLIVATPPRKMVSRGSGTKSLKKYTGISSVDYRGQSLTMDLTRSQD